ncbi:uncharacterized protein LOC111384688 [Olea europaea var. sylvestris]|uniref:uncharacterized protein LOC111384688 n=1 Tax=Olea europaea var. sylvestris TaxID=158386 RepID=UPI000C1D7B4F|nr:uncharacterized protein LOC111384688 [Olea europaea var. sylvestris]
MAHFEALYGRKYRPLVCWDEVGERKLLSPGYVWITDRRRINLEFDVGDRVFMLLSPWKGVTRFGKRGKLSPRYISLYEIVERISLVAYLLVLPTELSRIHDVFHVSMLHKYIPDSSHVLKSQPVDLKENLTYEEEPIQLLDRNEQVLHSKTILLVKVLWINHAVEEATWESEEQMCSQYPEIFHT